MKYYAEGMYYVDHSMATKALSASQLKHWEAMFGTERKILTAIVVERISTIPRALQQLEYAQYKAGRLTIVEYAQSMGTKPPGFWAQLESRAKREGRRP